MKPLPLLLTLLASLPVLACWAPPPPQVWFQSEDGAFPVLRDNRKGVIEIHRPEKDGAPVWTARPEGFSDLFSVVKVAPGGDCVVHIRGNHLVAKPEDLAVEILHRDGTRVAVTAGQLIAAIRRPPEDQPRESTDPGQYWLRSVGALDVRQLTLTNWDGDTRVVPLRPES